MGEWKKQLQVLKANEKKPHGPYRELSRTIFDNFTQDQVRDCLVEKELKTEIARIFLSEEDLKPYVMAKELVPDGSKRFRKVLQDRINIIWRKILKAAFQMVSFSIFFIDCLYLTLHILGIFMFEFQKYLLSIFDSQRKNNT